MVINRVCQKSYLSSWAFTAMQSKGVRKGELGLKAPFELDILQ